MDIVTHGMMGAVLAAPFAPAQPAAAGLFMLGSALPDLDAFSRVFGKRFFLQAHQTYTHSIPFILAFGGICWGILALAGIHAPLGPPALMLGMLLHSLLDVTNSYGITLLAPFTKRRFCLEWVFFIDAVVIALTFPALAWVGWEWSRTGLPGPAVPAVYAGLLAAYWPARIALRRRALRHCPEETLALLPSALVPWIYLGCARDGDGVLTFRIDARSGRRSDEKRVPILDEEWAGRLEDVVEFRVMRRLSPAYHVVEAAERDGGTAVTCRDLRTRNFHTRFGELSVVFGEDGQVREKVFHV